MATSSSQRGKDRLGLRRAWRFVRRPDVAIAAVAIVPGILTAALGLSNVPRIWIILGTVVLTAAGFSWGRSLLPELATESKHRLLHVTIALLIAFVVGIGLYSAFWDPSGHKPPMRTYGFTLRTSDESAYQNVSGYPRGPALVLSKENSYLPPLYGGQAYQFDCRTTLASGETWIRLAKGERSAGYWISAADVYPVTGVAVSEMPSCE